jgi:hypothetical protein
LIELHAKDLVLLKRIQSFFGGIGNIRSGQSRRSIVYSIAKIQDISDVLIPHFNNYPLLTKKRSDFLLFKQIVGLMVINKMNLSSADLLQIIGKKASINKGLSDELKEVFPSIALVPIPTVEFKGVPDPCWLAGFTAGEGCFFISGARERATHPRRSRGRVLI